MPNRITTVTRTVDSATGLATVEKYLYTTYLKEAEYKTVLANSSYFSKYSLPKQSGNYVEFTKPDKFRLPENGAEGGDPASGAAWTVTKVSLPIENIKEWTGITQELEDLSWMDIATGAKEKMREALRRGMHTRAQDMFLVGRMKPGKRNSSGATVGDASYPYFRYAAEATVTLYGQSFTFNSARRYYTRGKDNFSQLVADDFHDMATYRMIATRMANSHIPKIKDGYVCVISEAVQRDLMSDSGFLKALEISRRSEPLFDNHIITYAGIHWVIDDEPCALQLGGNANRYVDGGDCHASFMFGQDCFGYLRLGGKNASAQGLQFKVQDISKTGSYTTIGYTVPFQCGITWQDGTACIIGPVREFKSNNG